MPLFDQPITDVITVDDIKKNTGIASGDLPLEIDAGSTTTQEELFNDLLKTWIKSVGSHVKTRVKREFSSTDEEYEAIRDIVIRTVAKLVAVAVQQRSSPIVQINEFAVSVLNTSDVIKDLPKELKHFKQRRVSVFSSLEEYTET
ncbi:hypothetical protein ACTWP4_18660 [Gracilibacillus sp. D59]|uniref:hypothetical protein n=1 Tax=Gracilibacillus sp. D59 TaxID=3457434 RepID=UPI003FCD515D